LIAYIIIESYKYSREEAKELWELAKLAENVIWATAKGDYGQYTLARSSMCHGAHLR
jgi:hypothetical protein